MEIKPSAIIFRQWRIARGSWDWRDFSLATEFSAGFFTPKMVAWWANTFPRIYDLAVTCFFVKPDRAFGYFSEVCIYWLISWINFCSCQVFSYIVENSGTTVTPAMKAWVKYFARRSVINDCFPYQGKVSQRNITRYLGTVDSETKVFKPTTFPTLEETTCYYAFLEKLPYTNCGQEGVNSR